MRYIATAATLGNALAGAAAAWRAWTNGPADAWLPALLAAALVLDGIDGRLARRFGSLGDRGARLDAAADVVSFVALPAVALVASGQLLVAAVYATCGVLRLARFAASAAGASFRGLPASIAAAFVVLSIAIALPAAALSAVAVAAALLMVSPLRYPRMRDALAGWLWPAVALVAAHALALVAVPSWRMATLQSAFAIVLATLIGAPFVARPTPPPSPSPPPSWKT